MRVIVPCLFISHNMFLYLNKNKEKILNFSDPLEVYEALGIIRRKYKLTYKKLQELTGINYSRLAQTLELIRPASLKQYPKIYEGMYNYANVMKKQAKDIVENSNALLEELKNFSPRQFERCERDSDSVTDIKWSLDLATQHSLQFGAYGLFWGVASEDAFFDNVGHVLLN